MPTIADVFELIEPVDPDSIHAQGENEFLLNWIKGGFTNDQLGTLKANKRVSVLEGPYKPDHPAIIHQIRIKVL